MKDEGETYVMNAIPQSLLWGDTCFVRADNIVITDLYH